jgi:hypothetical protein
MADDFLYIYSCLYTVYIVTFKPTLLTQNHNSSRGFYPPTKNSIHISFEMFETYTLYHGNEEFD